MKINPTYRLCTCIVIVFVLMLTYSCNKVNDEDPIPVIEGSVKDIEGFVYKTIQIDIPTGLKKNLNITQATTQIWMAENLRTTKYSNGDEIGTTTPATMEIGAEATPKYQWAYLGNERTLILMAGYTPGLRLLTVVMYARRAGMFPQRQNELSWFIFLVDGMPLGAS